jgi:glycosyltransferase involved in cell wall biosynthesis
VRLLVVSQYFWPETFRVNDLVEGLVARGHEVTVLTGRPNYPEGRIYEAYRRDPSAFSRYAGATVLRVPLQPRGNGRLQLLLNYASFVFWGCLLGPWKLRNRRFDAIVFWEASPITSAIPAILLRRLKRTPLAMWVLDLWPETLAAVGIVRRPWALNVIGWLVAFIYKRCDLILAQSRSFFANIEKWSGDTSRVRYFPSWAEPLFAVDPGSVAKAPEMDRFAGGFTVMFAGNVGDAQDFPSVLAAFGHLRKRPDIRLIILGDGRAADQVRAEITGRGLAETVFMLGKHPLEKMPSFFRAADALLVSLKPEPIFAMTIPGKVQAYLAAGIPLLGMIDGEGARVIAESAAGFVCSAGDSVGLAEIIERLANMPATERTAMGQRGRDYGRREFDRNILIDRLVHWLEDAAASASERPR